MELIESITWALLGFGPTIAVLVLAAKGFPEQLDLRRSRRESVGGIRIDV
jgi:hypothetical protein